MQTPLVSCLCVTERREAFMPWLLWGFDRQTLANRELVIVDSSERPYRSDRSEVRVISAPPGSNIPEKRNLALEAARGEFVAWFDDDDWQHPQRLERLIGVVSGGRPFAGGSRSWFIDVVGFGCRRYNGHGALIFNTALFRRDVACSVRFDPRHRRASDTVWLRDIMLRHGSRGQLIDDCFMLWLCHDDNISNPRTRRGFPSQLDDVRADVGANAWADTRERLEALRFRLPVSVHRAPAFPGHALRREPWSVRGPRAGNRRPAAAPDPGQIPVAGPPVEPTHEAPPSAPARPASLLDYPQAPASASVTLLIVAAHSDAPHVERIAPHIRRQARFEFREAYALASREGDAALATSLERLRLQGTIGAVIEARAGADVSLTSLLDALELARGDFVLFARPTVLFHASGVSWVAEGAARLERDAHLLSMTTQAGPSVGPAGSARNAPLGVGSAVWDPVLRIWRHDEPPGAYALAPREKLRQMLGAAVGARPELLHTPWASGLRAALERAGTVHGSLAMKGSWALEVRGRLDPHVSSLVPSIERGIFPSHQPGEGLVALDVPAVVAAWRRIADISPGATSERAA